MTKVEFVEGYIDEIMKKGLGFDRESAKAWAERSYDNDPNKTDIPYAVSEDIHEALD